VDAAILVERAKNRPPSLADRIQQLLANESDRSVAGPG
jgi:hypothetical protein